MVLTPILAVGSTPYLIIFFHLKSFLYSSNGSLNYYYTEESSHFKVFRLGIHLAIFVVAPLVLLSLGRTESLFPCLKTSKSNTGGHQMTASCV